MLLKNVKVIRPKTTKIQKRNGIGYVYQVIGKSYKKDKKYTVENRKLIGKMIDEEWMIPNEYLCDPSSVYYLMLFEVRRRHKGIPQFAKHRIVSFAATDCILPQDVVSLAERIASIYAKKGYITAYGIHADRFNVHIHFAVCAVSLQTQNMFHIQWKSEWKMLVTVTNQWKSEFDEMLQNNIQMRQSREAALYGDDIVRYGSISLTAKGQMNQNKKSKRK